MELSLRKYLNQFASSSNPAHLTRNLRAAQQVEYTPSLDEEIPEEIIRSRCAVILKVDAQGSNQTVYYLGIGILLISTGCKKVI